MQFIAIALFAAAASAATVTEVDTQSTLVTVTDCASTVTDCPAHSTSAAPNTTAPANVTSFEAGAARNQYAAAGAAALAAGALLAFGLFTMNILDESKAIHAAVYQVVSTIPYGRVTSYGHIALLLGKPQNSRQVGSAMKNCRVIIELLNLEAGPEEQIDVGALPWWRVVLSAGKISPRENSSSEYLQAEKLKQEGVAVLKGHLVDIDEYGWFPDEVDL